MFWQNCGYQTAGLRLTGADPFNWNARKVGQNPLPGHWIFCNARKWVNINIFPNLTILSTNHMRDSLLFSYEWEKPWQYSTSRICIISVQRPMFIWLIVYGHDLDWKRCLVRRLEEFSSCRSFTSTATDATGRPSVLTVDPIVRRKLSAYQISHIVARARSFRCR